MINDLVQTPNRNNSQKISTHLEEQNLLPAEQKDITLEVKVARIN